MKIFMFLWALRLLRFRPLLHLFGRRAEPWLLRCVEQNYRLHIPLIIGHLVTSRSMGYCALMLSILGAVPLQEREAHEHLRSLFISERLHSQSVSDGLAVCRWAILVCGGVW